MSDQPPPSRRSPLIPGLFEPGEPILLSVFILTYLGFKQAFGGRAKSLATTAADLRLFIKFFRAQHGREPTLADLCDDVADQFFVWHMQQPRCKKQSTANRSRRSLLSVWRFAAAKGLCMRPGDLPQAKVDKLVPTAWSMSELGRLLAAARDGEWHWFQPRGRSRIAGWQTPAIDAGMWFFTQLVTAYYTGLRITALLMTPTPRLDLDAGGLHVPADVQKHRAEQWFPLPPDVITAWKRLDVRGRRLAHLGDDWPYDRKPGCNWKTLNSWLKRILRAADLVAEDDQDLRRSLWHKLRRTFATHLAAKEGIEAARRWLGHSSIAVTSRYIDPRYMPGINPVDALPKPVMPAAATISLSLFAGLE